MARVICIGMACADVVVRGVDLDRPPAEFGQSLPADSSSIGGGGDALNESIVLGHLGHDVCLMAGIGYDGAGAVVEALARRANVDMSLCKAVPEFCTPVSVILVGGADSRGFFRPPAGADGSFMTKVRYEPDLEHLRGANVVSLASLFSSPLDDPDLVLRIVKRAKAEGAIVCADVKPRQSGRSLLEMREAMPYIDYFFPNETDAAYFAPGKDGYEAMAKYFQSLGIKNVVLKIGAKGALFFGQNERFTMPPFPVTAVDTTGCGDNFAAGFISGLLRGFDAKGCCEYATAAASICAETVGASIGVKSMRQVDERRDAIQALYK